MFFVNFFRARVCSFACVAHFVFLGDVWIRTQKAAVASRYTYKLATQLPLQVFFTKHESKFVKTKVTKH